MAFKFEDCRLFGAADSTDAFVQAISLVAQAGARAPDGLESIDLTTAVYQRLGRELPTPLPAGDYLTEFPGDPWEMTGGTISIREGDAREVDLTAGARWALEEQRKMFVAKFGREPGSDDPVFFNPDADVPEPLTAEQQQQDLQRFWDAHPELEEIRADAEARRSTGMSVAVHPSPVGTIRVPAAPARSSSAATGGENRRSQKNWRSSRSLPRASSRRSSPPDGAPNDSGRLDTRVA
jgi:hypothetical protein